MRVAVVGAGIMGASTALALTDRGHEVTIFEQYPLPHAQGSSHGASRIVRRAYPDAFYTEIMLDAYPRWEVLDERLGGRVLFETGLLYVGAESSPDVQSMRQGLVDLDVEHVVFPHDQITEVYPALIAQPGEVGIFTPGAGWVAAERAVVGSIQLAQEYGATLIVEFVPDPVRLIENFDAVCICAGGWAKELFNLPLAVTLQTFAYLDLPPQGHGPVWIEDGPHGIYGFPPEPGTNRVKYGVHSPGDEIDPRSAERPFSDEKLELLKDFATRRWGISDPIPEPQSCLYSSTSNIDFLFGEAVSGVFWASPCSGHGFKFGPWVGALMADFVEQRQHPRDWPRFYHA